LVAEGVRERIVAGVRAAGYRYVALDLGRLRFGQPQRSAR
jgi:hypothetical protein